MEEGKYVFVVIGCANNYAQPVTNYILETKNMAETENTLREASRNGDTTTVTKLLADSVAQTPNEVLLWLLVFLIHLW